jgi:hypothetical protein
VDREPRWSPVGHRTDDGRQDRPEHRPAGEDFTVDAATAQEVRVAVRAEHPPVLDVR